MEFMLQRMPWEAEDIAFTHEEVTSQPHRGEGNQHNKDQNSSELYIFYNLKKQTNKKLVCTSLSYMGVLFF